MGHIGIRMVLDMLENERMIYRMVKVKKYGPMEQSIKEGIKKVKRMDRDNLSG